MAKTWRQYLNRLRNHPNSQIGASGQRTLSYYADKLDQPVPDPTKFTGKSLRLFLRGYIEQLEALDENRAGEHHFRALGEMLVSQEPVIRREFLRANDTTENVFVLLVLNDEQSVAFKFETKEERENYLSYRSQGKTAVVVSVLTWKQAQEWIEWIADTCGKPEESSFIQQELEDLRQHIGAIPNTSGLAR